MKYVHAKGTFLRKAPNLRTRKRVSASFVTAERLFGASFPQFGASLGVSYDQTDITKVSRAQSLA